MHAQRHRTILNLLAFVVNPVADTAVLATEGAFMLLPVCFLLSLVFFVPLYPLQTKQKDMPPKRQYGWRCQMNGKTGVCTPQRGSGEHGCGLEADTTDARRAVIHGGPSPTSRVLSSGQAGA